MQTMIHCRPELLQQWLRDIEAAPEAFLLEFQRVPGYLASLVHDAATAARLHVLVNSPYTHDFLEGTRLEAAHQVERHGVCDYGPEDWQAILSRLVGKCVAAALAGDREKALHHTISSAALLANWHRAILAGGRSFPHGADAREAGHA